MKSTTLAALSGAFAFSGMAAASPVFSEDFESGTGQWNAGAVWGSYGTGSDYSNSIHGRIPGGGGTYGNLISAKGSSVNGGPARATVNFLGSLTASESGAVAVGTATWDFDSWLASYTSDPEVTVLSIEWFDGVSAGGNSLGTQTLADGRYATGVTESISGNNPPSAATAWNTKNWSHYVTQGSVPAGAVSFTIAYGSSTGGNDCYADLLQLDITGTSAPGQPSGLAATLDDESGSVTLTWSPPTPPFQSNEVLVLRDGGQLASLTPDTDSYVDSPPLSNTAAQTFDYTLRFLDGGATAVELQTSVTWIPDSLTAGLVAYYRFEGDYRDTSGSATSHDGSPLGPPTLIGGGIYGHCVEFRDQASPRHAVVLGNHADFDFGAATDFSVSLWFRRLGPMEDNTALGGGSLDASLISDKDWASGGNIGWGIFTTSDGGVKWNFSNGSTRKDATIRSGFGSTGVADGQWHHLVVTHDRNGSANFYVDGTSAGSSSISGLGSIDTGLPLTLGADGALQYPWGGSLDEVAIWRRLLIPDEVASLYANNRKGRSVTGSSIIDSDGDGMDDGWEQSTFGSLNETAEGDYDRDGRKNYLEYAQGTNAADQSAQGVEVTKVEMGGQNYPLVRYLRSALAGDVAYHVEFSSDLHLWTSGDEYFIPSSTPEDLGGGLRRHGLRHHLPIAPGNDHRYFRVRVEPRYQAALSTSVEPTVEFRNGSAVIRWETDTPTVTILDYGFDGQAGGRFEDYTLRTVHEVVIPNVDPGEVLAFTVVAIENGNESRSQTITTTRAWDYSAPGIPDQAGYVTAGGWAAQAASLLALPETPDRGYCLDLRCGDGQLAFELARQSSLVVVAVEDTQPEVDAARQFLTERGVYGSRVNVVLASDLANLPFAVGTFNLVVSQSQVDGPTSFATLVSETSAHVIPGRGVIAGLDGSTWTATTKTAATGTDDWTQQYGSPANAGSNEETLGGRTTIPDFDLQWIGRPGPEIVIDRMVRAPAPLSANGRFYCQGMGRILALDSHNGSILWTRDIQDLRRLNMIRDASNMAAADEGLYLAVRSQCWQLAGDDGARTTFDVLPGPNPGFDYAWGYLARSGSQLLGSAVKSDAFYKQYWGQEFWYDAQSGGQTHQVCSDNLFSIDPSTGATNWEYTNGLILNATITVADGKVFFLETRNAGAISGDNRRLSASAWKSSLHFVCLDLANGSVLWDETPSISGGEPCIYIQYADGRLLVTGSEQSNDTYYLHGFDPIDGSLDWTASHGWKATHHGGNHQHPVIMNGAIFLEPHRYSLATGARTGNNVMPGRLGCSTFSGARDVLFYRGGGMSGQYAGSIGMWHPASGTTSATTRNRPSCWISWVPANGMLLVQEQGAGCSCGSWMETSFGLAPRP